MYDISLCYSYICIVCVIQYMQDFVLQRSILSDGKHKIITYMQPTILYLVQKAVFWHPNAGSLMSSFRLNFECQVSMIILCNIMKCDERYFIVNNSHCIYSKQHLYSQKLIY